MDWTKVKQKISVREIRLEYGKRKDFSFHALLIGVLLLLSFGLAVLFSTSSAEAIDSDLLFNPYSSLRKQLTCLFLGVFLGAYIYKIGAQKVLSWTPLMFWAVAFLLLLVLVPSIGKSVNGAKRWLQIGSLSFQPSEFMRLLLPLYLIYRWKNFEKYESELYRFIRSFWVAFVPVVLILLEPNNGTVFFLFLSTIACIFLFCISAKYWALPLFFGGIVLMAFAWQHPYVQKRLDSYLHPEADIKGKGHQPYQAKIATGSGKITGRGPGKSLQKLNYLPEAQNDYIGAVLAEEYGFIGVLFLVTLYALLALCGCFVALKQTNLMYFYASALITFMISLQACLNLGVVSGILPSTGLNLPFISQGGSSLIKELVALSLLLSLSGKSAEKKTL